MKNILVFLLIIVGVFSLDQQTYITGFANQLGFTQDQITDNIDCLKKAVTKIQDFKTTVISEGLSISDTDVINWVQQIKLILMRQCPVFENDMKVYFSENTRAPVFIKAFCDNLETYNAQVKQKLVAWASTLDSSQDLEAGKRQAYIYQILYGVVNPLTEPIASFTPTVSSMSMTVPFDGSASSDPDGSIVNYNWDFGETSSPSNVVSGSSSSVSHTYSSAGNYTVTLTVTDNSGNTAKTTSSVRINDLPVPTFTYSISGNTITFDASGSTDSDGAIATYAWTFGESGSSSNTLSGTTNSASHTYATTGTYTVVLTVTDNQAAYVSDTQNIKINAPPTVSFTPSISRRTVSFDGLASSDPDGGIVDYAWDFGDSASSSNTASGSSATATHTYPPAGGAFTVTLVATDTDGATSTTTQVITIVANLAPTGDFTPTLSVSSSTLNYDASGSVDPDGTIAKYEWDFGEPSSSSNTASTTSSTTTHTYASAGTYTVTLTVTDNEGATNTVTKSVRVNAQPVASFTTSTTRRVGSFNAGASSDADGTVTNYAWDFGEPTRPSNTASGSSSTASHTYRQTGGTFTVTLTVTDNDGATTTTTRSITVVANSAPTASFTATVSGGTVTLNAGASSDSDGSISTYAWNFGDGNTGSSSSTSHTYSSSGTYSIVLTVTDDEGSTGTQTTSVSVTTITASFSTSASAAGNQITFTSTSTGGTFTNYQWSFGDGYSSSGSSSSVAHTYGSAGTYSVTLTVTSSSGSTASCTNSITVTFNCDNLLHLTASWNVQGDYDMVLTLPSGNYIGYTNRGPDSSTSYGKLIQDSGSMAVPEEICWQSNTPPSGTYYICVNPYSTSGGLPSTVTLTLVRNGVTYTYSKTMTTGRTTQSCSPSDTSYITSFSY